MPQSALPLCLYHVPGRSGYWLSSEQVVDLSKHPNIQWIKEASGNMSYFSQCRRDADAEMLSGDDLSYLASLAVGGVGVISVISNIFPKEWAMMGNLMMAGQREKALALHESLFALNSALYCESNPVPVKAALGLLGHCRSMVRLPLGPLQAGNLDILKLTLEKTNAELKRLCRELEL